MAEYLAGMSLLHALDISHGFGGSLAFLSRGSLPTCLTSLALSNFEWRLPVEELHCIDALQALRSLSVKTDVFERELTEEKTAPYRVPSALLPSLRDFSYGE